MSFKKPVADSVPAGAGSPTTLPTPDFHFTGEVGRTYLESDAPQFPQPVQAPTGAPNIVLILLDDVGFGQFSTFGGGVPSPTMDRLASEGLRYNHFHTTAHPTAFRLIRLTDLGFVIPVGIVTGLALLQRKPWSSQLAYAFTGMETLLACAVAGMAIRMWLVAATDTSAAFAAVITSAAVGLIALYCVLIRHTLTIERRIALIARRVTASAPPGARRGAA